MNKRTFAGKKLLILGGAAQCNIVVETAKELGIYTIVADVNVLAPAKKISDASIDISVMDYEELYQWCLHNPIDGILNYNIDFAQNTHQILCERLGLPSYGTADQYRTLIDKVLFKNYCSVNGVDIIPEYDEDEIDTIQYPIIIKPCESSGSRGVFICNNPDEVKEAILQAKKCSRNGRVIIEKYLGNSQDITIAYLVVNGTPHLIMLGDRYQGDKEDGLDCQINCIFLPSRYHKLYMEKVNDKVINMIKTLGIQNGPVFIQGFVDGDTVRMYDPAIRFPGNEYGRIFEKALGINLIREMIKYSLTGIISLDENRLFNSYNLNNKRAVEYMVCVGPGYISSFRGLDKLQQYDVIVDVRQKRFEGEIVEKTGDIKHRGAEISILVDDVFSEVYKSTKLVQDTVKCFDDRGNSMLVSLFDISKIQDLYYEILL